MRLQQTITVAGMPLSGVMTASNFIGKHFGFSVKSFDSLIDGIYYDLMTVFNHYNINQQTVARNDVILKNGLMMNRIFKMSVEEAVKYPRKWLNQISANNNELLTKSMIRDDLNNLSETWRVDIFKEDIEKYHTSGIIITNPYNEKEFNFSRNNISIWIERPKYLRLRTCYANGYDYDNLYKQAYLGTINKLKQQADFIIYNDSTKLNLCKELQRLMKGVLHFESTQ